MAGCSSQLFMKPGGGNGGLAPTARETSSATDAMVPTNQITKH